MADIDLLIRIPEEDFERCKKRYQMRINIMGDAIANGTVLPKGQWLRMSDLSEQEDDRYKCSRCGNVIHHKNKTDLYTFNSWCGRCGSDNGRFKIPTIVEADKESEG